VAVNPNSNTPASTVKHISLTLDGALITLCGPDGLQTVPGSSTELVVVENGSCNPPSGDGDRVVRITLDLD
jgi:NADPH:quinone reductase-like Zn-dependent oxidoreductase